MKGRPPVGTCEECHSPFCDRHGRWVDNAITVHHKDKPPEVRGGWLCTKCIRRHEGAVSLPRT